MISPRQFADGLMEGRLRIEEDGPSAPVPRGLTAAARKVHHSGDYGILYWNPRTRAVFWNMADSDGPPDYDGEKDIRAKLAVAGVEDIEFGDEGGPGDDDFIKVDYHNVNESAEIQAQMDAIIAAVRERMASVGPELLALNPTEYDWMTGEERAQMHALKLRLPSHGEERLAARQRLALKRGRRWTPESVEADYPLAGDQVDGLEVDPDVPNTSSIASSLAEYTVLRGIRAVPMSEFTIGPRFFYAADDFAHAERLAQQIEDSGRIKPLIVVVDAEGPYILEGAHRAYALHLMGKTAMPALVVLEEEEPVMETRHRQRMPPELGRYRVDCEALSEEEEEYTCHGFLLLSRNTKDGQKPFRATLFDAEMNALVHEELDRAELDINEWYEDDELPGFTAFLQDYLDPNIQGWTVRPIESGLRESAPLHAPTDGYLYHVTFSGRLNDIAEQGLQPNSGRGIGGESYDSHRQGRVFLTTADGLHFWFSRAEDFAEHGADDYVAEGMVPVVIRVRAGAAGTLQADDIGTQDAGGRDAWYSAEGIDPSDLEWWDGTRWASLDYAGETTDFSVAVDPEDEMFLRDSPFYPAGV